MNFNFIEGEILLFDKPKGWSSFDLVRKVRSLISKLYGKKIKVGHAGTLDPMATGLLILATGKKTKILNQLQGLDKEYIATIKIGATTPSYDAETSINNYFPTEHITEEIIIDTAKSFIGKQLQIPPKYSAKKIKGKKAYELVRKGVDFELKPVEIEFKKIEILYISLPNEISFRLLVSKGTYIRSFAYDFGRKLNSGAYLTQLRRIKVGQYNINQAITIEQFKIILDSLKNKKN